MQGNIDDTLNLMLLKCSYIVTALEVETGTVNILSGYEVCNSVCPECQNGLLTYKRSFGPYPS